MGGKWRVTQSSREGHWVERCCFKEIAHSCIHSSVHSVTHSFKYLLCARHWVGLWGERIERGQRAHGLERERRIIIGYSWVSKD